jgi:hypothetical protein
MTKGDKRKMNKEELKQDAEKSLDKRLGTYAYIRKQDCYTNYVDGYIDGAEPREKRIAELEAQIEKMKNWCNCKNYSQCLIELAEQGKGMKPSECCVNCKKWELEDYKTRLERRNKKKQEIKEND